MGKLSKIIPAMGLIMLVLLVMVQIISDGRNSIAAAYQFLLVGLLCLGFIMPKQSVYGIIFLAAYVDLLKRLMILDLSVSFQDLYYILGAPIAMTFGAFIATLLKIVAVRGKKKISYKLLFSTVTIIVLGFVLDFVGGGGGLSAAATAAGGWAYYALMPIICYHFKYEEINKLFRYILLVFLPVMLYGISQSLFGMTAFEYNYLLSGLTIESRQLSRAVFRYFSTLNSAQALTMVCATYIGVIGFLGFQGRLAKNNSFLNGLIFIVLLIITTWCMMITYTRAGWLSALVVVALWGILKFRYGHLIIFMTGLTVLIVFMSIPSQLEKMFEDGHAHLADLSSASDLEVQAFQTSTFRDRMFGFVAIREQPGKYLQPFGVMAAGTVVEDEPLPTHDAFTEILMKIGYIPFFIVMSVLIYLWFSLFKKIWSFREKEVRTKLTSLIAIVIGVLAGSAAGASAFKVFPMGVFLAIILSALIMILRNEREKEHSRIHERIDSERDTNRNG